MPDLYVVGEELFDPTPDVYSLLYGTLDHTLETYQNEFPRHDFRCVIVLSCAILSSVIAPAPSQFTAMQLSNATA